MLPANYTVPDSTSKAFTRWRLIRLRLRTSNCNLLLTYLPQKDERLSRLGWLTYSVRMDEAYTSYVRTTLVYLVLSWSLDVESVKTLVHAFVTTRLDYCNSVLAGAPTPPSMPRSATDKLQRVLNAAARLVSGIPANSIVVCHASAARRPALTGRSRACAVQARRNSALVPATQSPAVYLIDCVTPASDIASRQRLRSASRHQLPVPCYQLSSLRRRSFAVAAAAPTTWNSLSADLLRSAIRRVVTSLSDVH